MEVAMHVDAHTACLVVLAYLTWGGFWHKCAYLTMPNLNFLGPTLNS